MEHPEFPIDPSGKMIRINTISGHYFYEALDGGKRCRMHYINEFDFGGSIPKSLVQNGALDKFIQNIARLKKLIMKDCPEHMTKAT